VQAAAALGGTISSGALAAFAACTAAMASRSHPAGRAVRLHRAAFLPGGPTHGAGFGLLLTALGMAGHRTGQLPPPLASAALASAVPNLLAPIYLVMADVGVADPRRTLPRPDHHRHRRTLRRPRPLTSWHSSPRIYWTYPSSISERIIMIAKRRARRTVEPTAGREGRARPYVTGPQLVGPRVLGPTAMAPLALAAAGIGALAIGRLAIAEAVVRRLRAGEVTIRSLKVGELEVGGRPWPGPANTIEPGR